jgi:phosphoglycolate phosphatase-like HAD superfamily hydrolase
MLLDKQNEPDFDKRIEKAFRDYGSDQAKPDEDLYESYVRGGVDVIYEKLINGSQQPGDYLRKLYEFLEEFEERYSQNSDEILDLVRLAAG